MKTEYVVLDPTGNVTALVTGPVPVWEQPSAAARLMAREPDVEQVGFLSPGSDADVTLRMAGGEFCGNASMCAAAQYADRNGLGACAVTLRVSGAGDPVSVRLSAPAAGARRSTVSMPLPVRIARVPLPGAGEIPVVFFAGIAHALLPHTWDRSRAEADAPGWAERLGAGALGVLLLDREGGRLDPLVFVPAAGTLVWERSCASGTAAAGAWLAEARGGPVRLTLAQPGGSLTVEASPDGPLLLTGSVKPLRSGVL